jgi:hypothetical protein
VLDVLKQLREQLLAFLNDLEGRRMQLVSVLLVAFVLLGVAVATIIPPFQVPDESEHWLLASTRWTRLTGASGACTTSTPIWSDFDKARARRIEPLPSGLVANVSKTKPTCIPRVRMYGSLLTYPGAVLSLMLFTNRNSSPVELLRALYAGRILQGLMLALVLWRFARMAGKTQSPGALSLIAFLLGGLAMQEAFGVTADGIMFAFAVSLCGVMIAWDRLAVLDVFLFASLGGIACTTKPFLTPTVIPVLFAGFTYGQLRAAPLGLFAGVRAFAGLALPRRRPVTVANAMVWVGLGLCVASVVASYLDFGTLPTRFQAADQRTFLLHHPRVLLVDLPRSVLDELHGLADLMGPLGWLDTVVSTQTVAGWQHLLWLAVGLEFALVAPRFSAHFAKRLPVPSNCEVGDNTARRPALSGGVAFVGVCLSAVLCFYVTILPLYLTWTRPGSHRLEGFQARYLIPNVMICIGAFFGYLSTMCAPRPDDHALPATGTGGRSVVSAAALAIGVAMALLSLSLLSHLYSDIAARFH